MIIETHAHYDDEAFDADREELLRELPENGIGRVINVGASMQTTRNSIALAEKYPFIYAAVGVHPDDVAELDETAMEELRGYCRREITVAVGEIGLDYYWHKEPEHQKLQQHWFRQQLVIAREEKLPFIIHSRDAAQDTFEILKQENAGEIGGVVHCYSGSAEDAVQLAAQGLYIGFGGACTFNGAKRAAKAIDALPLDAIVLETDCPYMAAEPVRGTRCDSSLIRYVGAYIAQRKALAPEEVFRATAANARRVFGL